MKKGGTGEEGRGEDGRWRKDPCTDDQQLPTCPCNCKLVLYRVHTGQDVGLF